MMDNNFEAFKARKSQEGYDQVLERVWEPNFFNEPHDHPFDTDAIVAQGEYWLTVDGKTTHFKTGDSFQVARGVVHSERYGPEGAVFWAARKNSSAP
jgi:mannose-6-phosphate isomerase-like protein (cupin superfamily)